MLYFGLIDEFLGDSSGCKVSVLLIAILLGRWPARLSAHVPENIKGRVWEFTEHAIDASVDVKLGLIVGRARIRQVVVSESPWVHSKLQVVHLGDEV